MTKFNKPKDVHIGVLAGFSEKNIKYLERLKIDISINKYLYHRCDTAHAKSITTDWNIKNIEIADFKSQNGSGRRWFSVGNPYSFVSNSREDAHADSIYVTVELTNDLKRFLYSHLFPDNDKKITNKIKSTFKDDVKQMMKCNPVFKNEGKTLTIGIPKYSWYMFHKNADCPNLQSILVKDQLKGKDDISSIIISSDDEKS